MSAARARRRMGMMQIAGVLAVIALLSVHASDPADGAVSTASTFAGVATLTATSADLVGLVYEGVVTVPTSTGSIDTIKLTSTAATITDLSLHPPCTPISGLGAGMTTGTMTAGQGLSQASGGLTLYATTITGTAASGTVTWSPASPPPASQLGDVSLSDVSAELVAMNAPTLALPGLRQATRYCAT